MTSDADSKKSSPAGEALNIDFSCLSVENRREGRISFRSPILVQEPGSPAAITGTSQDVSPTGFGILLEKCNLKAGDEVQIQFYGANAPSVSGSFKVVRVTPDVKNGKPIFRVGLTIGAMTKLAEKNFLDLLKDLETRHGFSFDPNR